MGCTAPHMNCPTAIARLIDAMPSAVLVLSGARNRPSDWRAPMVTIRMPAAESVTAQSAGVLSERNMSVTFAGDLGLVGASIARGVRSKRFQRRGRRGAEDAEKNQNFRPLH